MVSRNLMAYIVVIIIISHFCGNALAETHDWKAIPTSKENFETKWYLAPTTISPLPNNVFSLWVKIDKPKLNFTRILNVYLYCDEWKHSFLDFEEIFKQKTTDKLFLPDVYKSDIAKGTILADIFFSLCSTIKDGEK